MLDERPEAMPADRSPNIVHFRTPTSPVSTWRLAARLARREVRRRPGRTVLVMALVMVPVVAMTIGIVAGRSSGPMTLDEKWEASYGQTDAVVRLLPSPEVVAEQGREFASVGLPDGSITEEYLSVNTAIEAVPLESSEGVAETSFVDYTEFPFASAIADGVYDLVDGRAPSAEGEVVLTPDLADRYGVSVGDELVLETPNLTWSVVGIAEKGIDLDERAVLVETIDPDDIVDEHEVWTTLITFPADVTDAEVTAIVDQNRTGEVSGFLEARADWRGAEAGVDPFAVFMGWVAGVVALVAVGIVIAAAFAASARRQLVTVGQLSANGAPSRLIRRTLALQGTWTGLFGGVLGIGLGLVAVGVGRPLIEAATNQRVDGLTVRPTDLVVILSTATVAATVAALIPSKSASRLPVLAALAGRRPVATPPRWMAPTGLALFVGGFLLLAGAVGTAASGDAADFVVVMAVIGGLAILFGVVCSSPFVVHGIGLVADRLRGSLRLAARSLARTRGRSAAVVTAIATVMTLATAAMTGAASLRSHQDAERATEPGNRSIAQLYYYRDLFERDTEPVMAGEVEEPRLRSDLSFEELSASQPVPDELRDDVEQILPDAEWIPIRSANYVDSQVRSGRLTVADAALVDRLDLTDDQLERLEESGAVSTTPFVSGEQLVTTPAGEVTIEVGPPLSQQEWDEGRGAPALEFGAEALITEEAARRAGLVVTVVGYVVENPEELTEEQRDGLDALRRIGFPSAFVADGGDRSQPEVDDRDGVWEVSVSRPGSLAPVGLISTITLTVALLFVLAVVGIGLSLSATEGRDERSALHAVGAAPSTLRRLAAAKAVLLTAAATIVSVPTGYAVMRVIFAVDDESTTTPWFGVAALVVGVPAVAGLVTLVVSGVAQRLRPTPSRVVRGV